MCPSAGPGPDLGPLLRTLLRLRHDLVMIGRAAAVPLPEAFQMRFAAPLARVGNSAAIICAGAQRRWPRDAIPRSSVLLKLLSTTAPRRSTLFAAKALHEICR